MPAVVTDQFRIANAGNFVDSVLDSNNSYYVFLGLPNPTPRTVGFGRSDLSNWPANPVDNLEYLTHYRDTSLFGKKINSSNIRRVVKKHNWVANSRYDMYRHDYNVEGNKAPNGQTGSLYKTNYYVLTSEFKVYICLDNGGSGTDPSTSRGGESLDEPTFTDLEPAAAGVQDDYVWKYLFTISPSDVIKFDSTEFIVLPNDWTTSTEAQIQAVREAGDSDINKNQLKTIYIEKGGSGYNGSQADSKSVSIIGDGTGGKALVTFDTNGTIIDAVVTAGGSGYTYATVDLSDYNTGVAESNRAKLIPIIPPSKGHGFNIYTELGADKVLVYSRFDDSTKDFPTDTHFSQVGIIKNPTQFSSTGISTASQFSSLSSIKLVGSNLGAVINSDSLIGLELSQTRSDGNVAKGYVASYDKETTVLKYIQDRSLCFGNKVDQTDNVNNNDIFEFQSAGGNIDFSGGIVGGSESIQTGFTGITTTIGSKLVNLGVQFTNGLANPEINKKTGDVIYIDNRKEVERDIRQKEDVKIILEF